MNNNFILLLFALLLTLVLTDDDNNSGVQTLDLSLYQCTFHYQNGKNNKIVFLNCITPENTYSSWSKCLNSCCGKGSANDYPSPSESALQKCEQFNREALETLSAIRIFLFTLAVAAFIVICCCCCCAFCRRCRNPTGPINQVVHDAQYVHKPTVTKVEWEQEKQINFGSQLTLVWSISAKPSRKLKNNHQPCAICLQEETTAELFCGHQYHPVCIGEWLRKSSVCPCCRMENVRGIKVYCRQCRWRYFVCTRSLMTVGCRDLPLRCVSCEEGIGGAQFDFSLSQLMAQQTYSNEKIVKQSHQQQILS